MTKWISNYFCHVRLTIPSSTFQLVVASVYWISKADLDFSDIRSQIFVHFEADSNFSQYLSAILQQLNKMCSASQMVVNEHKFIIKASSSAAQLPSFTKPNKDFRLFVKFIIPNSEGERYVLKRTFGLIVEYELIDASRSEGAQAAVEYHSKISLHFGKDFTIFCEGKWRQHINKNNAKQTALFSTRMLVIESMCWLLSQFRS
jgi:hypothetical protein